MFKFFNKFIKPKDENSLRFKQEFAARLDGKHIKYVTERQNYEDLVIGRDGCIAVRNGELIVLADGVEKLRVKVAEMQASELMSLDGVILSGPDLEKGGEYRTVIAYYKYYR
ncbi:MAG: hypothetical protein E7593_04495 [Ruminococcaceae bacterium]|nr:hypothetical protein [Oscillospiraceae bacterium]